MKSPKIEELEKSFSNLDLKSQKDQMNLLDVPQERISLGDTGRRGRNDRKGSIKKLTAAKSSSDDDEVVMEKPLV